MGGDATKWAQSSGPRYPYPKWVWTPLGGWWADPKYWRRNTLAVFLGFFLPANLLTCYVSAQTEEHHRTPKSWVPSMLWASEFKQGGKYYEQALKFSGKQPSGDSD